MKKLIFTKSIIRIVVRTLIVLSVIFFTYAGIEIQEGFILIAGAYLGLEGVKAYTKKGGKKCC